VLYAILASLPILMQDSIPLLESSVNYKNYFYALSSIYVYSEGKVMVHPLWIFRRWRQWKVFFDHKCVSHGVLQLLQIYRKRIVYGFFRSTLFGFRNLL